MRERERERESCPLSDRGRSLCNDCCRETCSQVREAVFNVGVSTVGGVVEGESWDSEGVAAVAVGGGIVCCKESEVLTLVAGGVGVPCASEGVPDVVVRGGIVC